MTPDAPQEPRTSADPLAGAYWALEATTDNVILVDREFRITFINRAAARLNDVAPESVLGRTIWEQWPGNLGTDIERNYRKAMAEGVPVRFVHGYVEEGRFDLWLEIQACPSPDGLAIFFHDVTDAKRQAAREAEEQERLASAIRATELGVWRCNLPLDDHPFDWSPQVRRHFGISDDESVDARVFLELLHPDDRAPTAEAMRRAIEDRVPYDVVYRTLGRDGRTRWVRATGNAFYREDGTPTRFDGFTVELTERIETERALRETQARLDATLASADVGTWVLDVSNDRINGDPNLGRLFGMTEAEARAGSAADYLARVHPDDQGPVAAALGKALAEGSHYDAEYRVLVGDRVRWLVARGNAERDHEGRVARLPGIVLDITVLKETQARERAALETMRASERRQRLRVELIDALRGEGRAEAIAAIACRVVGEHLGACRSAYAVVDREAETLDVTTGWVDGVEPMAGRYRYEEFGRELLRSFEAGMPFAVEDTRTHPLTRDQYETGFAPIAIGAFLVAPVMRAGALVGYFAVHDRDPRVWAREETELLEDAAGRAWDAIERAAAEADLRALNASLDDIVRRRTEELTRANQESEAFNYSIAHDLRTPLRAVNATSRILLDELADVLDSDARALLERQAHNARRMGSLIDALLNLSRLGRQSLARRDLDLTALAREAFRTVEAHSDAACSEVEVAEGLRAHADASLVRLVFQNLLENACKFSPNGGTVRVGGEGGTFWVRDEGVGFDMAFAPKIFLPFERLVSEAEFPGTGIGLANVKRIVERHGGRVWAESAPGKGATFSFTLG